MDCSESIRKIQPFIKKELSRSETCRFIDHVKNCRECYEELEVSFLVNYISRNMNGREDQTDYNLSRVLTEELYRRKKEVIRFRLLTGSAILLTAAAIAFLILHFLLKVW